VTLLAVAAERRAAATLLLGVRRPPQSIDTSCAHGAQQQTAARRGCGRMMGQTNRQTDGRTLDSFVDAAAQCQ